MKKISKILSHCSIWTTATLASLILWTPIAQAHPLGNFTINHYAGVQVSPDRIGVDYVLDMAEIPAFQEMRQIDRQADPQSDASHPHQYAARKCDEVNSQLNLSLILNADQTPLPLNLKHSNVEFPDGMGGLSTLRLTCDFEHPLTTKETTKLTPNDSAQTGPSIEFSDHLYPDRLGWREITVIAQDLPLQGDVTSTSVSKRLTEYPTDLLSSPLNQRQVTFSTLPSGLLAPTINSAEPNASDRQKSPSLDRSEDPFTRLIKLQTLNLPTVIFSLLVAFVWGGLHALSPGHGKTIVGAYLVGSRGTFKQAILLGLTVTATHTAGIFALGLLTLGSTQFEVTEQIYPWLSILSGGLVTAIGIKLFTDRLRENQPILSLPSLTNDHEHSHPHPHEHSHEHPHKHEHPHPHPHKHSHEHPHKHDQQHSHDHEAQKSHEPGYHTHGVGQAPHSHLPANNEPITGASLIALGISGGLLPCPSALVVLLSSIALGRVGFGLALVTAFSLGLAAMLTLVGLVLVYSRDRFERLPMPQVATQFLPAMSALAITLMGVGMTTSALVSYAY